MIQTMALKLLAGVVAPVLAGGVGWHYGVKMERGEAALRENATAVATANAAREAAEAEGRAALLAAQVAASRRAAARAKQHQLEMELARDETARHCRVSDGTLGVLNDAIARANGAKAEASGRDGAVPAATVTGGAVGLRPGALDLGFGGNLFGLRGQPPTPQGVDQR